MHWKLDEEVKIKNNFSAFESQWIELKMAKKNRNLFLRGLLLDQKMI